MSRFFTNQPIDLAENIFYNPDLNLAMNAIQMKDAKIGENLANLELLGTEMFDYWYDADKDAAMEYRDALEGKIDNITRDMMGDITNTAGATQAINNLRREVLRDTESGTLRYLQENVKKKAEFEAALDKIEDPGRRQRYRQHYMDSYIKNPDRAPDELFSFNEMFDHEDVWNDFVQSGGFLKLNPDEEVVGITRTQGLYFVDTTEKRVELSAEKVEKAFKAFIKSKGLEDYAKDDQEIFGNQWFDSEGNLSYEDGYVLGDILRLGSESQQYLNTHNERRLRENQVAIYQAQARAQAEAQRAANETMIRLLAGNEVDAKNFVNLMDETDEMGMVGVNKFFHDLLGTMTPKEDIERLRNIVGTQLNLDPNQLTVFDLEAFLLADGKPFGVEIPHDVRDRMLNKIQTRKNDYKLSATTYANQFGMSYQDFKIAQELGNESVKSSTGTIKFKPASNIIILEDDIPYQVNNNTFNYADYPHSKYPYVDSSGRPKKNSIGRGGRRHKRPQSVPISRNGYTLTELSQKTVIKDGVVFEPTQSTYSEKSYIPSYNNEGATNGGVVKLTFGDEWAGSFYIDPEDFMYNMPQQNN